VQDAIRGEIPKHFVCLDLPWANNTAAIPKMFIHAHNKQAKNGIEQKQNILESNKPLGLTANWAEET